ncbi:hypothetical protein Tco_0983846, partial [Tanacetum coccineum]
MLESEAFKTYRAYATGEKAPKSKATKKKTDFESSPKTKPSQASKGKRIKTSAKGDKPATTKSKGLTVLSEVALSEAEQMKLATKRSLKEFHLSCKWLRSESEEESWTFSQGEDEEEDEEHDSDDDNDDNDDEDDDQENDSQRTESDDEGDDFVHPNLSTYIADDQEKEKADDDDDDDDVTSDQKVSTPPDYELTKEDENQEDDDTMGEDQEDEENRELYEDLNLNLDRQDAEMTDGQTNQETEEAHMTLTTEPPIVQTTSSSVSSDLVAKFINPSPDTGQTVVKYVTKLWSKVLVRSTNQPQTSYANLYRALLEAYNSDKDLLSSYGEVVILKKGRDDQVKDKEPSTGSNRGYDQISTKIIRQVCSRREADPRLKIWKTISLRVRTGKLDVSLSERQQMLMNDYGIHLALKLLIEKGTKQRRLTTDLLNNWHNPEGRPYPHDLSKPLPLIQNARGHQVIPFDLKYIKGGSLSQKYTTSLTKPKVADYGHVKWIEDKVPRSIWSTAQVVYDKHAYWGTYHWGPKLQSIYGYATNMETSKDVYSRHKIIVVTSLKIMEFFYYKHLEEIIVRRQDDQLYKFREGDFKRLRRQDIEDMLLLLVQ